ncbi:MAG: PIN domain-containing protein [Oscillospiraceae bacterium]|nr:PIN domain-containing protein [Oscillospiraceae bacterium]
MQDKVFIDTNIFVYLYSSDEKDKKEKCLSAIGNYDCYTSTQAINELINVLIKKFNVKPNIIKEVIDEIYSSCIVNNVDKEIINKALDIHFTYGFSYYDSLMLSSALNSQCTQILTEDMNNNQLIDNVLKITNIFID